MAHQRKAVLLPYTVAGEVQQVSVPATLTDNASYSNWQTDYAHLFKDDTSATYPVSVTPLPLNSYFDPQDAILLLHRTGEAGNSSAALSPNPFANEILAVQGDRDALSIAPLSSSSPLTITGECYVIYQDPSRDFLLSPDWEALHDTCYGARLDNASKKNKNSSDQGQHNHISLEELAKQFTARRTLLSGRLEATEVKMEDGAEEEEAWTDEEVEKPREPKPEIDSDDDQEMEVGADGDNAEEAEEDEDSEDSEASYEDESELESDDEDDPRKKALLDMIKASIMKDGKLDLERLGLVEKNGKLVPKDD